MNKIIHFLIFIAVLLQACHNDDLNDVYKDYRFKTKVVLNEGSDADNLYLNGSFPMKISIEKNDPDIGSYDFSYVPQQGKGMLWYKDSLLLPGLPITISEEKEISLKYIPTTAGNHSMTFNFKNDNLNVTDRFTGKVGRQFFMLKPCDLPPKILVDNPTTFNIELVAPEDEAGKFKTNVVFTSGAGQVHILKTQDTIPDKPSDFLTKGYNKISFTSTKQGLNNLRFTLQNNYALSQTIDVPVNVVLPDFSVQTICDTNVMAGKNNFILKIDNADPLASNHYWVTFRSILNAGTLSINNNPLESGNLLEVKIGDNICEFTPQNLGPTQLEFIVRDKYSTIRKDTASFNVAKSSVDIKITNIKEEAPIYDLTSFNLAANTPNYAGQYKIEILQEPIKSELFINGVSYNGGRISLLNKDNTLIGFIPKETGNMKLSVCIYDDYNSMSKKEVNFKITNSEGKINISNQNPSVNILGQTNFNFSINKQKYEGNFQFEITTTPANAGVLQINGKDYSGGKMQVDNPDNTRVGFVPHRIGDIILHLTAYDKFGGIMKEDITYSVSNTTIQLGVTNLERELIVGKKSSFNLSVNKPFLNTDQNLQFSIRSDSAYQGIIYVDNQYYLPNSVIKIKNQSNVTITYLPNEEGKVTLYLNVCDDYMGSADHPVTFNITNPPIKVETADYMKDICINTENKFSFSVNKENYKGKFKVNIVPSSEGMQNLKLNGKIYENGSMTLESSDNNLISFTPNTTGEFDLKLLITDETKAKTEKIIRFNVTNPELQLHISILESDLSIYERSYFSFIVTKANYKGKFYFEVFPKNCKDVKIGNMACIEGEKQLLTTPSGSTLSFIPTEIGTDTVSIRLKVYDEWGSVIEKQVNFSVNNSSINLQVTNFESQLVLGRSNTFIIKADKHNYHGNLNFEITQTPEQGQFSVNGEAYLNGKREFNSDEPLHISYTPQKEGNVKVNIAVTDHFGEKKSASLEYHISNPELHLEVSDFISSATYNVATHFYASAHKMYYENPFYYSLATEPVNAGVLKYNDTLYTGGRITHNADPVKFTFIPSTSGKVIVHLNVTDKTGKVVTRDLSYFVATYPLEVTVSNQETSLILNKSTSFNFSAYKKEYKGKYLFEIIQEPANAGTLKMDSLVYQGGKTEINKIHNTPIHFTPTVTGDIRLLLKVYSEQDEVTTQEINYTVSNSYFEIVGSNQEKNIILGKPTTFNIAMVKQNYSGDYQYEIELNPAGSGTIIVDGSPYKGGKQKFKNPSASTIQYTSSQPGLNFLTFTIYDEFGASMQKTFDFNVENPVVNLDVTNKTENLILKTPTQFNVTINKQYYSEDFEYQIDQIPAEAGTIMIDSIPYKGGRQKVADPHNLQIGFTPFKEGNVSLSLTVWDKVGGEARKTLNFAVDNPAISTTLSSYSPDIIVNTTSQVNFAVSKKAYNGKFSAKISMSPAEMGNIKLNGKPYKGEKIILNDLNNNLIEFTPQRTGAVSIELEVSDEWGEKCHKTINYSISNSEIKVTTEGKEYELLLNKATQLSFTADKPNYSGMFNAQIISEPTDAGELRINNSSYRDGWINVNPTGNLIEFIPKKTGAVLLCLSVKDDLGGEKEIALNYNVSNPDINISVSNKKDELIINTPSFFNFALSKENYTGNYDIQINTIPTGSAKIKINDKDYSGGVISLENPQNAKLDFTTRQEGFFMIQIIAKDQTGSEKIKNLEFNVLNPPINLDINNSTHNLTTGQTVRFGIKANKNNYQGIYHYEVSPYPYDCGKILVAGKTELNGELTSNPAEISFTPIMTGNITLNIKVTDTWGGSTEKQVNYTVSNTPIAIKILNQEENIILNKPTNFNLSIEKSHYTDDQNVYYSISPAKNLIVDGLPYNGGLLQTKYAKIKGGIPVSYTPTQVGNTTLAFYVKDDYNQTEQKEIDFNITNPDLNVFLSGVTESGKNEVNLNETFKFTLNVAKEFYTDEFGYWITTTPSDAAMVAASDITPRTRAANSGTITGTIGNSAYGMSSAEIRITPNNQAYLNQNFTTEIRVRDKWGNEVTKTVEFHISSSEIMVNVIRNSVSIPVLQPYQFYFTVNKPNYEETFKYSLIGYADNDVLEVSNDGSTWTKYLGGKFEVLSPDHSYIRFTPSRIGTVPLKLVIYDINNFYTEKDITFDVTAPKIKLTGGGLKTGETDAFIPFDITATEDQGNNLRLSFDVDDELDGTVLFNQKNVYNSLSRSVVQNTATIESGKTSKMEIMSRKQGTYSTVITASNTFNSSASATATVDVSKPIYFTLNTTQSGEGSVEVQPKKTEYPQGSDVTLIATPAIGWNFVRWEGDLSGSLSKQQIKMNGNKNIKAIFEKKPTVKAYFNYTTKVEAASEHYISKVNIEIYVDIKDSKGTVIYHGSIIGAGNKENTADIEPTSDYEMIITARTTSEVTINMHEKLVRQSENFTYTLANGQTSTSRNIKVKGSDLVNGINKFVLSASYTVK